MYGVLIYIDRQALGPNCNTLEHFLSQDKPGQSSPSGSREIGHLAISNNQQDGPS
jgi:hypothetical protein